MGCKIMMIWVVTFLMEIVVNTINKSIFQWTHRILIFLASNIENLKLDVC